ncbi:MAG: hypothetical protein KC410_18675 [Anaerolineales bacterium]|uniref:helix-hairpin-helix domain-containing protein n=1 Tax=Promineifilum sp. TaxID=2664178 RepID=UPI001D833B47|nr:hypothetical protein [Anaerolineales bacterium]MCO5180496.1 hypothetical protein [Promineifilum sp.]
MSNKILNPKAWYLLAVGAAALAIDGTRRIIRRRRQGEPVIPGEVPAAVRSGAKKAGAAFEEFEIKIEEQAEPITRPVKKAAGKAKDALEDVGDKVGDAAKAVVKPVKKAADKAGDALEDVGDRVGDATRAVVKPVKKVMGKAEATAEEAGDKVEEKAETVAASLRETVASASAPDDLTEIKGIGPTFAKRLTAAGITTYAAVAASTPDYLREVTQAPPMAEPDEWIAQASVLAVAA